MQDALIRSDTSGGTRFARLRPRRFAAAWSIISSRDTIPAAGREQRSSPFLATRRDYFTELISIHPDASAKHKSLPIDPPASERLSCRATSNAFHPSNYVASLASACRFRSGIGSGRSHTERNARDQLHMPSFDRTPVNTSAGPGCPEASRRQCCQQYRQHCHRSPEDAPAPRAPNAN